MIKDTTKNTLSDLKKYPPKNYEGFDLDRLVLHTMLVLQDKKIPLYFDYISVGLFKQFPTKFSMANFRQYPDTNRISKALRRLTDQKRRRWATGNIENGFQLTDLGAEIAKQVSNFLVNPESSNKKPKLKTKSRGRSYSDNIQEIKESDAFMNWKNGKEINNYEVFAFLKAASYTPKPLLVEHLEQLKNSATVAKDEEVMEFLNWFNKKFNNLIN